VDIINQYVPSLTQHQWDTSSQHLDMRSCNLESTTSRKTTNTYKTQFNETTARSMKLSLSGTVTDMWHVVGVTFNTTASLKNSRYSSAGLTSRACN